MSSDLVRPLGRRIAFAAAAVVACLFTCPGASAQTPRVLYTWGGTGDLREWGHNFGTSTGVAYDNNLAGILRVTEGVTHLGAGYAFSDNANRLDDNAQSTVGNGGLDLYGLDSVEFDLAMFNFSGLPVNVSFFVQASPSFNFFNTPDFAVPADNSVNTYSLSLASLTPAQKAHIRVIGVEVREHAGAGDSFFQLSEVRSAGTPDIHRVLATHEPGSLDGGLNGARINFEQGAVAGNNGGANQTGLSASNGLLTWTDLGGQTGAAISYQNGQHPWAGNDFESRPHDNTNYRYVTFRMRATDDPNDPDADTSLGVQGFTQTEGPYTYNVLADLNLPVDGEFHDIVFPLGIYKSAYTMNASINLQAHANNVIVDIDSVIYTVPEPATFALCGLAALCIAGGRRRQVA